MAGLLHMIMAQWSEPSFLKSNIIPRLQCVLAFVGYEGVWAKFYFIFLFLMGFPSSCIMKFIKIVIFFLFFSKHKHKRLERTIGKKFSVSFPNPLPSTFNSFVRSQLLINFFTPTLVLISVFEFLN